MHDMTSKAWQRLGSSIIWSPELLGPVVLNGDAVPLRVVLGWLENGFPESPPGGRTTVVTGGLQTVLESFPASANDAAFTWLRQNIKPLVRAFQSHWGNVGLVFAMDGPDKLFNFNGVGARVSAGVRNRFRRARVSAERGCPSAGVRNRFLSLGNGSEHAPLRAACGLHS